MDVTKLNSELLRVSTTIKQIDTAIAEMYGTEIGSYDDLTPLLHQDTSKSYRHVGRAFNFVIEQYNSLVIRHLFIDEMGDAAVRLRKLRIDGLVVATVDRVARQKLNDLIVGLAFVTSAVNLMGVDINKAPEVHFEPVKSTEWEVEATLEQKWGTTQGAAFDGDNYYVFGSTGATGGKMMLSVVNRHDERQSFVATGDLGDLLSGSQLDTPQDNALGHANDSAVVSRDSSEVTLLVSSMIRNEIATCIVNLRDRTARIGKRIPITGFNSAQYSVQLMAGNKVMVRALDAYWTAKYNENGMHFVKFARHVDMRQVVKDLGYKSAAVYQADWYENGYLYTSAWLPDLRASLIVETIPQGADDQAVVSNRHWYGYDKGRKFEIEKVWYDNGEMYANVAQSNPYEHHIIKPIWKENNE
ncbi:hypothetical protein OIT44_02785 [Weissella ceti]|uniref:Uncharacterized protein n=1 Tax=Weissella ceti TaxID=759620 RepID=A0ABT3E453_9LACO|nr:hypothetical protein [Weissella ceti]MCW0952997.1 hypothetical protein [Weissella ceti]QVK11543.1 hypothetical protein KHQ31_04795 [Weissella ceti]